MQSKIIKINDKQITLFYHIFLFKKVIYFIYFEQQISILELFFKNDGTLKTGVMMLSIQLCHHNKKLYFKINNN